jgi:hypothetical protein
VRVVYSITKKMLSALFKLLVRMEMKCGSGGTRRFA